MNLDGVAERIPETAQGHATQVTRVGLATDPQAKDFIFAMDHNGGKERIMVLETKGDHLDNSDTEYKQKVLEACTDAFRFENVTGRGELELVVDEKTTVSCTLIFEGQWKTDLAKSLED